MFGTGLAIWRYWAVGVGKSEIFVGVGPSERTDNLIEATIQHCTDDLRIVYMGDLEADRFYVKY